MRKKITTLLVFITLCISSLLSCSDNVGLVKDSYVLSDTEPNDFSAIVDTILNDGDEQDIMIYDKGVLSDFQFFDVLEDIDQTDIYDIVEVDLITDELGDVSADDIKTDDILDSEQIYDIPEDSVLIKDVGIEDTENTESTSDLYTCIPKCDKNSCGLNDGCGGICTECPEGSVCNTKTWRCETICQPNCNNKECGDDGCGGECPPGCSIGQTCINGKCQGCSGEKFGQDFNLTHRCVRTVCDPSSPYYYEDKTGCNSPSSWLIAVESEASLGASCPGPVNCSFLINGPQSPVTIEWFPHKSDCGDNWTVHMLVDHSKYPSPCSGDYWTWFAFMDHQQTGGGPYPPAIDTISHHTLNFSSYTPTLDTSARVFIGGQWWWKGKARMIEFNLNLQQWGDADPHPGLIVRFDTPDFEFLALDASYWGLNIIQGQDTAVEIPWGRILQDAVGFGWFTPPSSWSDAIPMAYFIGVEVKNKGIASLWHTDFRIMRK